MGWLGLWLWPITTYGTDTTSPFGKIKKKELASTYYLLDSTAVAVILRNNGQVRIKYIDDIGFRAYYTREVKIKIYRNTAFHWADVSLSHYVKDKYKAGRVRDVEASSYTLDSGGKPISYQQLTDCPGAVPGTKERLSGITDETSGKIVLRKVESK